MPLLAVVDRPGLKQKTPPTEEKTEPAPKKQESDYHNSILLKMTPKLSKLELVILSIVDGICKGNKKSKTCSLSLKELTEKVAFRMPSHSTNQRSVRRARIRLQKRGLLIHVNTWKQKKVLTTAIPRAEAEGFKGLQIPMSAATDPTLSHAAKLIFGRFHYLLTVNDEQRVYIQWTDAKIAEDLNIGLRQASEALASLTAAGYLFIGGKTSRRRISLDPEWTSRNPFELPCYKRRHGKEGGDKKVPSLPERGDKKVPSAFPEQPDFVSKKPCFGPPNKYLTNNKHDFLSENHSKTASSFGSRTPKPPMSRKERLPILTVEKGDQMPVSERAIERILNHWNSKGAPLTRHRSGGTSKFRKIKVALQAALLVDSEQAILEAIDLYHSCLTDPTMTLHRYRKMAPTNVGLDEFFKFTPESLNMINVYGIGTLKGAGSWFEIAKKGEKAARDRFGIVPEDKHPIVTSMLKKIVRSLDDRRRVAGNESERILRQASSKLVEFHQRIRPRIISWRKVDAFSPCEFLQTKLGDFMRENLNLERFELYWLLSGRFYRDFERHLEQIGALSREMEPRTRHRYGKPTEKDFATSSCLRHQCTPTACVDDPTIPDHVKVGRPR